MVKIYAVIDTNVLVSALLSRFKDTSTVQLLQLLILGEITPIYNDEIFEEYQTVLTRSRFGFPDTLIDETLDVIRRYGINSSRTEASEQLPDPKDVVFYEVALSVEDSFLVTGNTKHFPRKPFVVTPAEMLRIIHEMKTPKSGLLSEPAARYGRK
ncbi:MAG: putative toxin-antitoxin system toxin component, PIN family [Bacteroidales bacterium]|nr:putative toxin-antitoxin system toxin component, PIN family [Bacteroidales bacterium]